MNGVSYLALGIGLLTETTFALGQVAGQMTVAQVTGSVPSAGVLITPPRAPVPVPSSGVLATVERHAVVTLPLKTTQKFQITKRPGRTRRYVVHRRAAVRSEMMTRGTTTAQQRIATPSMVGTAADQPRHAGIGFEFFLSPLGKGKVTGE
jgi:hypothetical protein